MLSFGTHWYMCKYHSCQNLPRLLHLRLLWPTPHAALADLGTDVLQCLEPRSTFCHDSWNRNSISVCAAALLDKQCCGVQKDVWFHERMRNCWTNLQSFIQGALWRADKRTNRQTDGYMNGPMDGQPASLSLGEYLGRVTLLHTRSLWWRRQTDGRTDGYTCVWVKTWALWHSSRQGPIAAISCSSCPTICTISWSHSTPIAFRMTTIATSCNQS